MPESPTPAKNLQVHDTPINVNREGAQLLFQVISACYEKRSMIVTTNVELGRPVTIFLGQAVQPRAIYEGSAGSRTENRAPPPGRFRAVTVPSACSTSERTMASPSPRCPSRLVRFE